LPGAFEAGYHEPWFEILLAVDRLCAASQADLRTGLVAWGEGVNLAPVALRELQPAPALAEAGNIRGVAAVD
jgi:hypothetical protein